MSAQGTTSAPVSRTGFNESGSDIPQGTVLKLVAGGGYRSVAPCAATTDPIYGVAAQDIKDGERGLVFIGGTVPSLVTAPLTVGATAGTSAAGAAVVAGAAVSVLGRVVTAGSATDLAEVELMIGGSTPA